MMRRVFQWVTFSLLFAGVAAAAEPVTIGHVETLASDVLSEERTLMISLPASYEGSDSDYPVVYLIDPQTRFHHTTGTLAALARSGHIPEMIVVGIVNTQRTRDLTPEWTGDAPDPEKLGVGRVQMVSTGGGADHFLQFLRNELIPHVEGSYRTTPFRVLIGHSFGGLFAVHSFVTDPDLFQAHLAISPSLWWDNGRTVEEARALFTSRPDLHGYLYLTLADEGGEMLEEFQNMKTLLHYRAPENLSWQAHILDNEDHGSIPLPSVYSGIRAFFPQWQLPPFIQSEGLGAVDRHFAALADEYGYPIHTPETTINNLGYQLLGEEKIDEAIEIFRTNVERFPSSANVYDSLGEALEAADRLKEALTLYTRAYEISKERNDPNLSAYADHRDTLEKKLEGGS